MKADQARTLARLAFAYHVTPAQLRQCSIRELVAMDRHLAEVERKSKKR